MIVFKVIIQEMPDGKIAFHCETPPGMATMQEQDAGRSFMEMFKEFTLKNGRTTIVQDWKGTNDGKRN